MLTVFPRVVESLPIRWLVLNRVKEYRSDFSQRRFCMFIFRRRQSFISRDVLLDPVQEMMSECFSVRNLGRKLTLALVFLEIGSSSERSRDQTWVTCLMAENRIPEMSEAYRSPYRQAG